MDSTTFNVLFAEEKNLFVRLKLIVEFLLQKWWFTTILLQFGLVEGNNMQECAECEKA